MISSITLAGMIRRPITWTAGNWPLRMARYSVISETPKIRAVSATLWNLGWTVFASRPMAVNFLIICLLCGEPQSEPVIRRA